MANNNHATKADLNSLRGELKGDLKALRDELKGDMAALRGELKADMAALRGELKADMASLREELIEAIHDMETKLLTAFYGFAEATQKRMTNLEKSTGGLTDLLATLDRRVTDLEKRFNFPNAS